MCRVYYFDLSSAGIVRDFSDISPDRLKYVNRISDARRKYQSYFATKLLEYALKDNGVDFTCGFSCENGKWKLLSGLINFSISHSNNLVCVGVSKSVIGVDVEKIDEKILLLEKKYPINKSFSNREEKILEYLKFWTEKEARFKAQVETESKFFKIKDNNDSHVLCVVCSEEIELIKINSL
ncbi:MAG: hypothetical protein IJW43_03755 [Clostridia bacterium]|nr:hypothetical protein [Clostridia bacterium]